MTKIILTFALVLISLFGFSQTSVNEINKNVAETVQTTENINSIDIDVSVTNATSDKGEIYFTIYNKEGFYKRDAIQRIKSKIVDGKASVTFKMEKAGTYAILCYHDSNSNKKMDFDETGMPKEDYGTSKNIMAFGPPNFEQCKFELTDKALEFEINF